MRIVQSFLTAITTKPSIRAAVSAVTGDERQKVVVAGSNPAISSTKCHLPL